jgi:hypothetical protein
MSIYPVTLFFETMHRAPPFLLRHDAFLLGITTIYTPILSIEHTLIAAIYIWDEIFFYFPAKLDLFAAVTCFFTVFSSVSNICIETLSLGKMTG